MRADRAIPKEERRKLSLFCNVRESAVIQALDVGHIYDVPMAYHKEGLDSEVLAAFGIDPAPKPRMERWQEVSEPHPQSGRRGDDRRRRQIHRPQGRLQIADRGAVAWRHGQPACKVKLDWIESEIFEKEDPAPFLEKVHGILVPGGFGERGSEGKILAAKFARERKVPYFGICFGMQMACIEAARSLAGIEDASSTEFGPTEEPVVGLMTEWLKGNMLEKRRAAGDLGGTMRLGAYEAQLAKRLQDRRDLRRHADFRAPPPPLRGQHRLQGAAGGLRPGLCRHVAGRRAARDGRISRPSLVHRRAVPSGAEEPAARAAPAVSPASSARRWSRAGWCKGLPSPEARSVLCGLIVASIRPQFDCIGAECQRC